MSRIGHDCQVILDGNGYFVQPGSYKVVRPKTIVFTRTVGTASALSTPTDLIDTSLPAPSATTGPAPAESVDRGPNQRIFTFDAMCLNTLKRYDGSPMGPIGQQLRDGLQHSYEKVAMPLDFVEPDGKHHWVSFTQYSETIQDLRTQRLGIDYIATVQLTECQAP